MDRVCKVCEVRQPIENFYVQRGNRIHKCKTCEGKRIEAYRVTHKEAIAATKAQYRVTHKEAIAATRAQYRETHKVAIAARASQYRETRKAALAARRVGYCKTHKEALAAYAAEYRKTHKAALAATRAQYYAANVKERRAKNAKYRARLPEALVRKILTQRTTLNSKDIPQSLVEAKRLQIQILRMIKNEKCE
jgi:hypothetical protein